MSEIKFQVIFHLTIFLRSAGLLLLHTGRLNLLRLFRFLHLLLHLQLLSEPSYQLGLQSFGAQRSVLQFLTQIIHLNRHTHTDEEAAQQGMGPK